MESEWLDLTLKPGVKRGWLNSRLNHILPANKDCGSCPHLFFSSQVSEETSSPYNLVVFLLICIWISHLERYLRTVRAVTALAALSLVQVKIKWSNCLNKGVVLPLHPIHTLHTCRIWCSALSWQEQTIDLHRFCFFWSSLVSWSSYTPSTWWKEVTLCPVLS